jgi:hypothetical protein
MDYYAFLKFMFVAHLLPFGTTVGKGVQKLANLPHVIYEWSKITFWLQSEGLEKNLNLQNNIALIKL